MRFLLWFATCTALLCNVSYAAERIITEMNIPATLSFIPKVVQDHPIISIIIASAVIFYLILRIRKFLRCK